MPKRYSIAQARAALATIVAQVEAGTDVELTRRGEPVAIVMSPNEYARLRGGQSDFSQAYRRYLKNHGAAGAGVDAAFFAELRHRTDGRRVEL